jgi:D-aminopeptidase
MPRFSDFDLVEDVLPSGALNSITDVAGVRVGHYTLVSGDGEWQPGKGPFRTGVTLILPHDGNLYTEKVPAAVHTINGFGKVAGFEQTRELGNIETPIALTSTLNVPRVADALMTLAIERNPYIGVGFKETGRTGHSAVNPVVGETNDGYLSDMQARPIGENEVRQAIASATSELVIEGAVGAGTGTSCYGWKGGIGTASRVVGEEAGSFTVGALVQSNFGRANELKIAGVPIGTYLKPPDEPVEQQPGSIMMIMATDAPLDSRQLGRLCHRAAFGLARTGSTCHGESGDFVIAFSTAYTIPDRADSLISTRPTIGREQQVLGALGRAAIEAIEEAIYNSLFMAITVVGHDGNTRYGLPTKEVISLIEQFRKG